MTMPPAFGNPDDGDDLIAAVNAAGGALVHTMGIVFTEVSAQRIVATMPVEGNTQPYGILHGGASVVLAESLGSVGSAMIAGADRVAVGIDINATHHRSVREGTVTGVAEPIYIGRTVVTYQVIITDEADKRVCTARITCMLRDLVPGS